MAPIVCYYDPDYNNVYEWGGVYLYNGKEFISYNQVTLNMLLVHKRIFRLGEL